MRGVVNRRAGFVALAVAVTAWCASVSSAEPEPTDASGSSRTLYAHNAVLDEHGVIAPWYAGQNGPCDLRIRIAAETLKRYPWTTTENAIARYPHYVFSGMWQIAADGTITPKNPGDWANGDWGQRATSVLVGMVDYYRYTGDPAAIAHLTYMADCLLDHCTTPPGHAWPGLFISVPVKGKAYGKCDPGGMIQLDICGSTGLGLLRAYQVVGNPRWLAAAQHWGNLLAEHCNLDPAADPWPRYANPEAAPWKDNKQTGGVTMILAFLDELIRLGYRGKDDRIVAARDAGRRYLRERLLPAWAVNDTWGRYFWDWANPVQNCLTTPDAARYLLDHPTQFPNWRTDARNILTLFLNRSGVSLDSSGGVYAGAWAYPEASQCCGRSLWYAPLCVAPTMAQYAALADDAWLRELAYRQFVLQTYDIRETGVSEDNVDGGIVVNGDWFNIAHPLPLRFLLQAIGWMPEELGPSRENHLVRSSDVVRSIVYGKGRVAYETFVVGPATAEPPTPAIDVLRLAFVPKEVTADDRALPLRRDLDANGYVVKPLPNGDAIVSLRRDGTSRVVVAGDDPQEVLDDTKFDYSGPWRIERAGAALEAGQHVAEATAAALTARFSGNQVRFVGSAGPDGGLADVYLDDQKQLVHVDCWNPSPRTQHVLYYRNGLADGPHTLRLVLRGSGNPYSAGSKVRVDAVQSSSAAGRHNFPTGGGPKDAQRLIFGFTGRKDYRDSQGNDWRPGTEFIARTGTGTDAVELAWWTRPVVESIGATADPDLYRYGIHGRDLRVYLTVGPGNYHVRLKFAATKQIDAAKNPFDVRINRRRVVRRLDVAATAGGPNRAVDLVFDDVAPRSGVVEVRLTGTRRLDGERVVHGEAFLQGLEIGPGPGGAGAAPVTSTLVEPTANLLANAGFEETAAGVVGNRGTGAQRHEWSYAFKGPRQSYIWQESDYQRHPEWGLPEFHAGKGALRTHTDADGHTQVFQDVDVEPNTPYHASVWIRACDLKGKGFGKHKDDSAGLIICELDENDNVFRRHPKVALTKAGPYQQLAFPFKTDPQTARVRFLLDTVIHCPYTEGHITYDDCRLSRR